MTAPLRPVPNARDTSFRAVHTNKPQVDFVSSGLGFAQEIHPAPAGQSCLDSETRAFIEVRCDAVNVFGRGDGYSGRIQRVQFNGSWVGIQQAVVALEIHEPRERRFPRAVRACDYRERRHALLGRVRRRFANDFEVFSGRGARKPTNLEFPAIMGLHHIEPIGVDSTNRVSVDFPRAVRARDYRERRHALLGRVRRRCANDFVVLRGRGARKPTNLEFPAIMGLHHIEPIAGRKAFAEALARGIFVLAPGGEAPLEESVSRWGRLRRRCCPRLLSFPTPRRSPTRRNCPRLPSCPRPRNCPRLPSCPRLRNCPTLRTNR